MPAQPHTDPDAGALAAPPEREEWLEDAGELPARPRRRLLAPLPLALVAVLLIACGFIGGVLVEKGQTGGSGASSPAASFASRFGALRRGATGGSGSGAGTAAGAGVTTGTVAFTSGGTLYITTAESNTVEVETSPATTVTKTVSSSAHSIHPGETVTVTGTSSSGGTLQAEAIRVGGGSSLGTLFGGAAGAGGGAAAGGSTSKGSSETPSLFGGG
jgi:hypothetical protein